MIIMRNRVLFILMCLLAGPLMAQDKKLSLEDAVLRQRTTLAPRRLAQLQWIPESNDFSYLENRDGGEVLWVASAAKPGSAALFSLASLNSYLKANGADTLSKIPPLTWKKDGVLQWESASKVWQYSRKEGTFSMKDAITLPAAAEVPEMSPGGMTAYVLDNNIWIENGHRQMQITSDGKYELVYGKSVHREEFGITKGLFWSGDGSRLAFYRMDQAMVTDYPVVDFSGLPAVNRPIKYPFSGQKSHQVTVGVYEVVSGKIIYLKTGEPLDQYLTNIAWSPDGKSVFIAVLNRDQNHMALRQYNAQDGSLIKTLFEEHDPKYTQPLHPVQFVKNHPDQFVWQSRRDGWNHLYLYDLSGKMIRQLTRGEWEVTDFNGFDAAGKKCFFHATSNHGLDRVFYAVELSSGKLTRLSTDPGMHVFIANDDKSFFLDSYSNLNTPRVTRVVNAAGNLQREILRAENPLKDYRSGKTRLFSIKAEDSTLLWCRMIVPADFDSTKRYPVIVYVYGGPGVQLITNSWLGNADLWFHYLTQEGFIVFTLDNRGSAFRGKNFEQATFRKLGDVEMADQISGINYLRKLPYIDGNRLGINGWSYGGFMTTSLMTRYPGIFKVAVAGGPVIDWSAYEVMYTERYMDTPEDNPGGYKISNLLNYTDQLNGRLMLIHGTSDNVVVWQHSLMYLKKAVSKGVQVDYFVYPGHEHNVLGKDRVHLNGKITRYFNDFLK